MELVYSFLSLFNTHSDCTFAFLPLLIGAGLGAVKHFASDQPAAAAKRKLAAETTRYSPYTGMVGEMPQDPNLMGSLFQGGLTGAAFGQGLNSGGVPTEVANPAAAHGVGGIGPFANPELYGSSVSTYRKMTGSPY